MSIHPLEADLFYTPEDLRVNEGETIEGELRLVRRTRETLEIWILRSSLSMPAKTGL